MESKETSSPRIQSVKDELVLPYLNNRGKFLYKTIPIIENGIFRDQDGVQYVVQFFQGLIESNEEINFTFYIREFARFFNRVVKENTLDHGLLAPITVIQLNPKDNLQYRAMLSLYCLPSIRIIDISKGDLSYPNMIKILNQETGLEKGFYADGQIPNNNMNWWESLNKF